MERLMQYLWQHRLWPKQKLRTTDGRSIRIIDPGRLNTDAGPDFFNAKIDIGGHIWAGDVEIHVRASDWHRHRHDSNPAYDSVILHVVGMDDAQITRRNGETIPQMCMPCTPDFSDRYNELAGQAGTTLPCAAEIPAIPRLHITSWLSALAFERLYAKAERIQQLLQRFAGDWESVCYITLARGLGFGINSDAFERLALSMPLRFIGEHSDSIIHIEALLFGQSGLLEKTDRSDPYVQRLLSEYSFLAHKFGLEAPQSLGWKMSRMRPQNFPHRRIALLASLLFGGFRLMSRILDTRSLQDAGALFNSASPDSYWASRYNFGHTSGRLISPLSQSSVSVLTVNTVVPLTYAYGLTHDDTTLTDRAVNLLQELPAEKNSVVELFTKAGIKPRDAFTTQAIIQLRRQYCEQRKCLYCRIGHRLLSAKAPR